MRILRSTICAPRGKHRFRAGLWENREGTAALEFAIVGPATIALLLAIMYTMLIYLAQQMLETAADSAGRMMLTGAAQTMTLPNGHVGMQAADSGMRSAMALPARMPITRVSLFQSCCRRCSIALGSPSM